MGLEAQFTHSYSRHFYWDISSICWKVTGPYFCQLMLLLLKKKKERERKETSVVGCIRLAGIRLTILLRTIIKAGKHTYNSCSKALEKNQSSQD